MKALTFLFLMSHHIVKYFISLLAQTIYKCRFFKNQTWEYEQEKLDFLKCKRLQNCHERRG